MTIRDVLLHEFLAPDGEERFVSGEEIARKCGVSRVAVWKAVEALRKQGAKIEAVKKRGYRLADDGLFNREAIVAKLPENSGVTVVFFDTLDSTNSEAKRRLSSAEPDALHKTVLVAAAQTAGRGRMGRSFYSPAHTGIYLSLIWCKEKISEPAKITALAAVAVCRALKEQYGADAKIKWVNDIFIDDKKVCGILTEGTANFESGCIESAVIGIGVNIAADKMPEELKGIVGGVVSSTENYRRSGLCAAVIRELLNLLEGAPEIKAEAMQEYKRRSNLIGKTIEVSPIIGASQENYSCTVQDIAEDAKLSVRLPDGTTRLLKSGEVTLHKNSD